MTPISKTQSSNTHPRKIQMIPLIYTIRKPFKIFKKRTNRHKMTEFRFHYVEAAVAEESNGQQDPYNIMWFS